MINVRSDKAILLVSDEVIAVRGVYDPSETAGRNKVKYAAHESEWAETERNGELFKTLIPDLTVGEIVVVESASRTGFSTIKITEVNADFDFDSDEPCRWITQRIDIDAHKDLRQREAAAVGKVKNAQRSSQREEIRRQMLGGEDAVEAVQAIASDFTGGDTTE
jgi:hypothetical protein